MGIWVGKRGRRIRIQEQGASQSRGGRHQLQQHWLMGAWIWNKAKGNGVGGRHQLERHGWVGGCGWLVLSKRT